MQNRPRPLGLRRRGKDRVVCELGGPHLWTREVSKNTDLAALLCRNCTHGVIALHALIERPVREVDPSDVDSGANDPTKHFGIVGGWTETGN